MYSPHRTLNNYLCATSQDSVTLQLNNLQVISIASLKGKLFNSFFLLRKAETETTKLKSFHSVMKVAASGSASAYDQWG